jgi:hypothetical protein
MQLELLMGVSDISSTSTACDRASRLNLRFVENKQAGLAVALEMLRAACAVGLVPRPADFLVAMDVAVLLGHINVRSRPLYCSIAK